MNRLSTSRTRGFLVAFAVALTGLAACSQSATQAPAAADTAADSAAIKANEIQWNQDYKARVVEPIALHYAHDGVLMIPGQAPAAGQDAIRAALADAMTDPKFTLSFTTDKVAVAASGDLAYTMGKYAATETNPKTHAVDHQSGGYVTVYRKATNGDWKAVADISTPGPASVAP